jgi:acetylglutamate kinase
VVVYEGHPFISQRLKKTGKKTKKKKEKRKKKDSLTSIIGQ